MGSEMCIRDRIAIVLGLITVVYYIVFLKDTPSLLHTLAEYLSFICLLYTSDAADERSSVDLGGRRIIKKKNI